MIQVDIPKLLSLCEKASDAVLTIYHKGPTKIENKKDLSPVTEADLLSNQIILAGLAAMYPDIPVISEEEKIPGYRIRKNWTYCWMLDPLDGTREFLHKTGEFTINLALIFNGKPVVGIVVVPAMSLSYFAKSGKGAFKKEGDKITPLQVKPYPARGQTKKITVSRFHSDKKTLVYLNTLNKKELVTVGSSLKILWVAEGKADLYPRLARLNEWDIAPTQVILEEAGGSVVSFYGNRVIRYNRRSLKLPAFKASSKPL